MVIVAASINTRFVILETSQARSSADIDALARSGLALAAAKITARENLQQVAGSFSARFDNGMIDGSYRNSAGLVDINTATIELLDAVFAYSGMVSAQRRRALAGRVVDWRDDDGQRILDGGDELDNYSDPLNPTPKNGPFSSVLELAQVPGFTEDERLRLDRLLTVSAGIGTVHPVLIHPGILAAISGISDDGVRRLKQLNVGDSDQILEIAASEPAIEGLVSQAISVSWQIEMSLSLANDKTKNVVATIAFVPNDHRLFRVIEMDTR
ncbi:MAG: hypothetical protein AAFY99_07840 [Pseudomonadota bacterium]